MSSNKEGKAVSSKDSPLRQRICPAFEEEKIQRKETGETVKGSEVNSLVNDALAHGGRPLDEETRSFMENRIGYDFSKVKVHTGSLASKSAQSINALAYTSGNHIVFKKGQYNTGSKAGKYLLAHELTHTIQQNQQKGQTVQRASDFCKPYATPAEAADAEWWLRNTYMRLEGLELSALRCIIFMTAI